MTEKEQAYAVLSRKAFFVRCCHYFSHFWLATVQEVLQADWQDAWHSPQPPFKADSLRLALLRVLICFFVICITLSGNLIINYILAQTYNNFKPHRLNNYFLLFLRLLLPPTPHTPPNEPDNIIISARSRLTAPGIFPKGIFIVNISRNISVPHTAPVTSPALRLSLDARKPPAKAPAAAQSIPAAASAASPAAMAFSSKADTSAINSISMTEPASAPAAAEKNLRLTSFISSTPCIYFV